MEDSIEQPVSGECIPDGGAWQFQGYGKQRFVSISERVHKVLCSAGEIACKGRQDFHLGSDGGFVIPVHSKKLTRK